MHTLNVRPLYSILNHCGIKYMYKSKLYWKQIICLNKKKMLVGTIQHPLPTVKCISYSTHVLLLNYFRDTCHYLSYKNKIIIKNNVQCAIGYILNEFITFTVLGTNCHYTGKIKLIKLLIRNEKRRNLLYFNILLSVIESISNL